MILPSVFVEDPILSLPIAADKKFQNSHQSPRKQQQSAHPPAGTCSRAQVCEAGLSHQLSPEGTDSFCASLPGSCRESRGGWERGLLPNTPRDSISKAQKRAQDNRDTEQAPIGILTFPPACSFLF